MLFLKLTAVQILVFDCIVGSSQVFTLKKKEGVLREIKVLVN